ncbi:MAG TPA: hemerythrin domain-containing protein [Pyrinomonadaceae bacterium]|nr:hemerythrin domain-containing protein [Pyrinomonadaceae bacterium]
MLFRSKPHLFAFVLVMSFAALILAGCGNASHDQTAAQNAQSIGHNDHQTAHSDPSKPQVPGSIAAEHKELHVALDNAVKSGGKTGEAAKVVADRLSSHFEKEEQYALPELGLLPQLAEGKVSADMKETIALADKLKAEMPQMLAEHNGIVEALDNLANAAKSENKTDAIEFAEKLKMHAQNEEEILYPAAILVGEYLKLRLK